jgi:hypothetical protein
MNRHSSNTTTMDDISMTTSSPIQKVKKLIRRIRHIKPPVHNTNDDSGYDESDDNCDDNKCMTISTQDGGERIYVDYGKSRSMRRSAVPCFISEAATIVSSEDLIENEKSGRGGHTNDL